ncbi:MAG TPA: threonine synthase [Blastocatellia bacterium]|nr:threonine synthase [Blastocatellia bacterium]
MDYEFNPAQDPDALKVAFRSRKTELNTAYLSGVWRFHELIPFISDLSGVVTLAEGNTPIYDGPASSRFAGLASVIFKHQGMNPTGSFKDNGMTTGVSMAKHLAAGSVACASTGNTSASMAAYAARAGMKSVVFVPAGQISFGKLAQALEYGAKVLELEGSFDDAMRIVRELSEETDLYLLNSVNPFRLEGQKTIIVELLEQLGWEPPDWIVLPGGNLGNTSAFGKALHELKALGFISRLPRLAVIQAKGAAPFYSVFKSADRSKLIPVEHPATLATAIRIGNPVSWKKALRSLEWTDGVVEQVTEHEIADAKAVIGQDGIGCEPASAVTLAGVKNLVASRIIKPDSRVICVLTGSLLKDPNYTIDYHSRSLALDKDGDRRMVMVTRANRPIRVRADKGEIKRALQLE